MVSRRSAKLAQAILEQVSSTILFGLKDPRVKNVTVIGVEASPDMRSAKVYISVMGNEKAQKLCLQGLNSARGFLQKKVADRLQTRYTPILKFILDPGVKQSIEASRLIREALADSEAEQEQNPEQIVLSKNAVKLERTEENPFEK
ncbi:MAG: 30S ribosome-binding factor RbfA [Planctomycetes bacterium]|nr:30S ribosome-binding factor RbfA [Planctomycetota bacterium]